MPVSQAPAWFSLAQKEVGTVEIPGSASSTRINAYFRDSGVPLAPNDDTPWCAVFVGAMLRRAGLRGTGSGLARSYLKYGRRLDAPVPGCIVVLRRGNSATLGHVGFFVSRGGQHIVVLGGNQSNSVSYARYNAADVLGYRWPDTSPETAALVTALGGTTESPSTVLQRLRINGSRTIKAVDTASIPAQTIFWGSTLTAVTKGLALAAPVFAIFDTIKEPVEKLDAAVTWAWGHFPILIALAGLVVLIQLVNVAGARVDDDMTGTNRSRKDPPQ